MADLSLVEFNADVRRFAEIIGQRQREVMQKIASELFGKIVGNMQAHRHPVDTGRARAGWGLTFAPSIATPPPGNYPAPQSPDFSLIDGRQVAYLLNSVPYIEALEDGHSKQAPNGFVRLSILELELEIDAIVALNP